ncbi:MAG: threonine/serine exporter family protein [Eubacteriales bacterium]|nr:threonine/serine exporter family protein [Eubacteriales bacterium]
MEAPWRMNALALAGRIIVENGGEIYRAEDTVVRMAQALGLSETDVFCIPSGLFISFTDEQGERQTSVNRIFTRGTHLARVDAVNQISRRMCGGELTDKQLLFELQKAALLGNKQSFWAVPFSSFLTTAGFTVMLGGGWWDVLVGGLCAAVTPLLPWLIVRKKEDTVLMMLVGSFLCTLLPLLFNQYTGLGFPDAMIAGALMPLVPGLSMTNAVQDVMRGDMVSGISHGARALLSAALIAGGALMATHLMGGMP